MVKLQAKMRRLRVLLAALLVPAVQPLLLSAAIPTSAILLVQAPGMAQSAEAVARIAQTITVRIEGATQGSGVLVKRDGNRYTVLTSWHVVSGQKLEEELDIYTPDRRRHKFELGSIKRLGEVDMAVLNFISLNAYALARIGEAKSISRGDPVVVAGFPLGSNGRLKYDTGKLVANAAVGIDQGYQLLYSNDTVAGMSGGVVLKADGTLIGMHGRGELDEKKTQQSGQLFKTGTNQGVPISYYSQYNAGRPVVASSTQATTADDYLAQARALLGKKGREQEVFRLTNYALASAQSPEAYLYQGIVKFHMNDVQGAISNLSRAIDIDPRFVQSYKWRGVMRIYSGDAARGCPDLRKTLSLGDVSIVDVVDRYCRQSVAVANLLIKQERSRDAVVETSKMYLRRGIKRLMSGDTKGAMADYNKAITANPQLDEAYESRGLVYETIGNLGKACKDWRTAATLGNENADLWVRLQCQ